MNSSANSTLQVASGAAMIAVETAGSGLPVVFLHANVCDRRMWRAQLDASGTDYQAIAYDRRGFGETRAQAQDHSAVADLIAVIDATAGSTPVILAGCSQGANIALNATLMHPARVRGLLLISPTVNGAPAPVYPPEILEMVARQRQAESAADLALVNEIKAEMFLDGPLADPGRVTGESRRLFLHMSAIALAAAPFGTNCDDMEAFARLETISVPASVICGELDFPHIQERARMVARLLPNAQGHALADVAHLAGLEQPDEVNGLLKDLVNRCT
ncbi:alpha/beta hydrolase [Achromobacter sp.]|uniref:alpha/beta fold hydrolase n=1 Tax=Achromobacter sp. TaxID=134375 RepID=UPI0028A0BBE9|nr:alpha/beta hydrolase [Achromobacter sp.]